jgi:predicted GIY-YIG superfamily endonuclease
MSFWVYLLRCSDGRYYTGHTEDLDVRLAQHQQGFFPTCWTYKRRPLELAWSEEVPTRDEAIVAERIVGGWSRAKKEALIGGDWKLVSYLSCPPGERTARFSTSLETNGEGNKKPSPSARSEYPTPLASEVEKRPSVIAPDPLASSEVEKPNLTRPEPFASSEVEKPVLAVTSVQQLSPFASSAVEKPLPPGISQ